MKRKPESLFDGIAETYYNLTPAIPGTYIQLLASTFRISKTDSIIDLGCGSGDLALGLKDYADSVAGLDISKSMIDMAKKKDREKQITWIQEPIEHFNLGKEKYNLIISFESFHLFSDPISVIQKCAKALKKGGAFCIGWRMYAFDIPLKKALEETFAEHNIPYEWGYWTCPTFPTMIKDAKAELYQPQEKYIDVAAHVSTNSIIEYVFNISNTASLSSNEKQKMSQDLEKRVAEIYPSGACIGYDQYFISYCRK